MQQLLGFFTFIVATTVWIAGNMHLRNRCLRRLGRPKPTKRDWVLSRKFPIGEYDPSERRWLALIVITTIVLGLVGSGLLNGVLL
jgi:hypothetical protein